MSLSEITEYDDDAGCNDLGYYRVDMESLYQYFQKNIIKGKVEQADHEVSQQLDSALNGRVVEHDILRHEETNGKGHDKGDDQCGAMGFEGQGPQVSDPVSQEEFEAYPVCGESQ